MIYTNRKPALRPANVGIPCPDRDHSSKESPIDPYRNQQLALAAYLLEPSYKGMLRVFSGMMLRDVLLSKRGVNKDIAAAIRADMYDLGKLAIKKHPRPDALFFALVKRQKFV